MPTAGMHPTPHSALYPARAWVSGAEAHQGHLQPGIVLLRTMQQSCSRQASGSCAEHEPTKAARSRALSSWRRPRRPCSSSKAAASSSSFSPLPPGGSHAAPWGPTICLSARFSALTCSPREAPQSWSGREAWVQLETPLSLERLSACPVP